MSEIKHVDISSDESLGYGLEQAFVDCDGNVHQCWNAVARRARELLQPGRDYANEKIKTLTDTLTHERLGEDVNMLKRNVAALRNASSIDSEKKAQSDQDLSDRLVALEEKIMGHSVIDDCIEDVVRHEAQIANLDNKVKMLEAGRITSGSCYRQNTRSLIDSTTKLEKQINGRLAVLENQLAVVEKFTHQNLGSIFSELRVLHQGQKDLKSRIIKNNIQVDPFFEAKPSIPQPKSKNQQEIK